MFGVWNITWLVDDDFVDSNFVVKIKAKKEFYDCVGTHLHVIKYKGVQTGMLYWYVKHLTHDRGFRRGF